MQIKSDSMKKFIVVGDRVLIRPGTDSGKTESGLYLPPGVSEKEKIQSGYVIKAGPGYPMAANLDEEPWKESKEAVKYIPLQVKEGDLAIFLRKEAFEIEFEKEKLLIVPQSAILLLIRNEDFSF
jgi:co-chaperonin GroES (HSP10)